MLAAFAFAFFATFATFALAAFSCTAPPGEPSDTSELVAGASKPAPEKPAKKKKPKSKTHVSDRARIAALGPLTGLDADARFAFAPTDFEPLPSAKPGEWLAEHFERGQTYPEFVKGQNVRPDATRDTLYIQPLGKLQASGAPAGRHLVQFAEAYFGVPTKLLPPLDAKKLKLKWRRRKSGPQLHTGSVLEVLKERLPADAFLMIAVTGHDLYPDDDWNFVFGIATFRERVGVYSTARYNPTFYNAKVAMPGFETIVLRRTLNIMAHEIGHMYGLEHCVHYRCAMNGSNSLAETDRSPIHMCPVCLRKLRRGAGFDIRDRYNALERYYRKRKLEEEADWLESRLERFPAKASPKRDK